MVVLKKIKGSTLMETLVATVLVIVIFMMASLILNTAFSSQIKNNTHHIKNHLYKLEYLYVSNNLNIPHYSEFREWRISISISKSNNNAHRTDILAINKNTKKQVTHTIYDH